MKVVVELAEEVQDDRSVADVTPDQLELGEGGWSSLGQVLLFQHLEAFSSECIIANIHNALQFLYLNRGE